MKKLNYLLLGAAGLLMASCSNDDVQAPVANDGNFTVRVQLPADMGTRAPVTPTATQYGQGYEAEVLHYYVYECDEDGVIKHLVTDGETTFPEGSLETEVGFSLVNGKYYQIAFFAQSDEANDVYSVDAENLTITVNYDKMTFDINNVDGYDCFYRLYPTGMIGAPGTNSSPTVLLYRPMAQINWGTDDLGSIAVKDDSAFGPQAATTIQTYFTADVYTEFNMETSNVQGTPTTQNFEAMNIPNTYQFPINGYNYLAMQYVLAPAAENNQEEGGYIYDLDLNVSSTNGSGHSVDVTVDNAPVQANWRTNIYGTLLTDNFKVYVVKEPTFWGEYNLGEWDGQSSTIPMQDENGVYQVNAPSDLAGLAAGIADGSIDADADIALNADLDFGGHPFAGIGSGSYQNNELVLNAYEGTFDGQGHTILDIVIEGDASTPAGFFNAVSGTVKDVTFANVNIQGGASTNGNAPAAVIGVLAENATASGVEVSGKVSGTNDVAGVVGLAQQGATITECTNSATITGNWNTGGVVGISQGATITDCTNNGPVNGNNNSVGGIVGEQDSMGAVTGCTNNGNVTGTDSSYGVGGIVGWIRYFSNEAEVLEVTVSGCENYGSVKGNWSVAGIVGRWTLGGKCLNNKNFANAITSSGNDAAGIVCLSIDQTFTSVPDAPAIMAITGNTSETKSTNITGKSAYTIYAGATRATVQASGNTPENAQIN